MPVTALELTRRQPFSHGYERLDGIIRFAVDPLHAANTPIVDLDKAARDEQGRVRFWADVTLLLPAEGNRRLLFYVVNRGRRPTVPLSRAAARPATEPPDDEIDPGDGFLLQRGWTVAMCGWQWDVERRPGMMGLEAPQALAADGQPFQGQIAVMFQPWERHSDQILSHYPQNPRPGRLPIAHKSYPAADVDDLDAVLTVRAAPRGPRTTMPRAAWRFAREINGQPVANDSHVWLEGGFEPGKIYEVVYRTRTCPVAGTGMLAVRDCTSFLRYDAAAPTAGLIDHTYGFGISQCGRFLRQYLYDAVNLDEDGRPAFDGLIPHVAGARRGEFNHRYAQPSAQHALGFGHLPPFHGNELLAPQRAKGGLPKVFTTNTASEYWRIDSSLTHTDEGGTRDVEPPREERVYMIAGHRHGSGALPLGDSEPSGVKLANKATVVDGSPVIRAFLINLDRWVAEGVEPPPNAFPRLSDGTAATREEVLAQLSKLPGLTPLDPDQLPTLTRIDLGPDAARGVGRFPAVSGSPYRSYVSAVDADGNEVAGIRTPELSVAVGTHTGWVARDPSTGGVGQAVDMQGLTLPLPATPSQRAATKDPRPSIAERYRDRAEYLARVRAEAEALAAARYVVAEDVDVLVDIAASRYDAFAPQPAGVAR